MISYNKSKIILKKSIIKLGEELVVVATQLEEAEMRWLELAEKA